VDKLADESEVQYYPKTHKVNAAGRWEERYRSYLGRSHMLSNLCGDTELACEKSAEVIVPARHEAGKDQTVIKSLRRKKGTRSCIKSRKLKNLQAGAGKIGWKPKITVMCASTTHSKLQHKTVRENYSKLCFVVTI
jgi:hypothetical protein